MARGFEPVINPAGFVIARRCDLAQTHLVFAGPSDDVFERSGRQPALLRERGIELDDGIEDGHRLDLSGRRSALHSGHQ